MKQAFQATLAVAIAAVTIAAFVPFTRPLSVSFEMASPPAWIPITSLLLVIGLPAALVAVVGLLRFKRWSRPLGLLVGLLFLGAFCLLLFKPPFVGLLAPAAIAIAILAAIAWFTTIALSYSRTLSCYFQS